MSALKNRGCKSDQTLHPPKRPPAPSHHTRCVQCAVDLPSRTKNGRKVCRLGVVWRVEPNCLLLHVRSIFNPVSTWWPENCSPQISDHVCHMSASRLTRVNERARTMRLSALSSARAKRSTENLSRVFVFTTSRYSLSCVRLAAAPHSCSTKRSKPFNESKKRHRSYHVCFKLQLSW